MFIFLFIFLLLGTYTYSIYMQTPTDDISVTHTNIHHTHVARVVEQFRFDSVRSEVRLFFNVNYRELPETHNWFLINCSFAFVVLEGFISEIYSLKVSWCAIQRIYPKRIHKVLECSDCVAHALSNRTCWLVTGDWITSIWNNRNWCFQSLSLLFNDLKEYSFDSQCINIRLSCVSSQIHRIARI